MALFGSSIEGDIHLYSIDINGILFYTIMMLTVYSELIISSPTVGSDDIDGILVVTMTAFDGSICEERPEGRNIYETGRYEAVDWLHTMTVPAVPGHLKSYNTEALYVIPLQSIFSSVG